MKHNYRIARRVYASTYANMVEQFKIYLKSLPHNTKDGIENDFRAMEMTYFLLGRQKVQ